MSIRVIVTQQPSRVVLAQDSLRVVVNSGPKYRVVVSSVTSDPIVLASSPRTRVVVQERPIAVSVTGKTRVVAVATGPRGVGVPAGGLAGGLAGQVLAKVDGTDYNTDWVNQSGGGGNSYFPGGW